MQVKKSNRNARFYNRFCNTRRFYNMLNKFFIFFGGCLKRYQSLSTFKKTKRKKLKLNEEQGSILNINSLAQR